MIFRRFVFASEQTRRAGTPTRELRDVAMDGKSRGARLLGRCAASTGEGDTMNAFSSLSPSWAALRPSRVMAQGLDHSLPKKASTPRYSDIAADDWDVLFRAVRARLRSTVDGPVTAENVSVNSALQTQDAVLDCVAALECLHTALACERRESRHAVFHAD